MRDINLPVNSYLLIQTQTLCLCLVTTDREYLPIHTSYSFLRTIAKILLIMFIDVFFPYQIKIAVVVLITLSTLIAVTNYIVVLLASYMLCYRDLEFLFLLQKTVLLTIQTQIALSKKATISFPVIIIVPSQLSTRGKQPSIIYSSERKKLGRRLNRKLVKQALA